MGHAGSRMPTDRAERCPTCGLGFSGPPGFFTQIWNTHRARCEAASPLDREFFVKTRRWPPKSGPGRWEKDPLSKNASSSVKES